MKKRMISALMAVMVASSLLVGCGGKGSGDASSETAKNEDGSTAISIWVHETDSPEGQLYKKLVDDFNEENKGKYHATLTQIARSGDAGGYDDKINAAISNGGLPDVFTIDGVRVGEFADAGAIVPIGEYFTEDDLADFNPDIIQQGTYNNELYAVGCFDSSVGIFCNKDMFEKAGITPATKEDPWTLEELTDAAEKLTTDDCYGITMALDATDETVIYFFLPLIQSQGSNVFADDGVTAEGYLNGDAALNTVTWIKEMVDKGYASATPEANSFELGKAAMAVNGSWAPARLAEYDINWGLMPMAKYDENSDPASACGSWTFGMSKDCPDEKKEAPLDVFQYQLANTSQARPVSVNYAVLSKSLLRQYRMFLREWIRRKLWMKL